MIYRGVSYKFLSLKLIYLLNSSTREALEISLKNVGRSDIKKEKDRDNYRTKVKVIVKNYELIKNCKGQYNEIFSHNIIHEWGQNKINSYFKVTKLFELINSEVWRSPIRVL